MINTKSKFLIIVTISALVVAAIYSSSVSVVTAADELICVPMPIIGAYVCYQKTTTSAKAYNCTMAGSGWNCEQLAIKPPSPSLKDALVKASKHIAAAGGGSNETSGNNTEGKIMTLRPPLLKQGLLGNNTQP